MRKSVWLCVNMSSQLSGTIDLFQQLHEMCSIERVSLNEGCIYRGKYNIMYRCVLGVGVYTSSHIILNTCLCHNIQTSYASIYVHTICTAVCIYSVSKLI